MREHLRIVVNGCLHKVSGRSASTTLSEFLRYTLRLTGTKDACAAGDCGACTVLVGRPSPDGYQYRAINSCIQFLFQLDGAHVITIEGLVSQGYTAFSTALAEWHGVQCGFCAPGIVMAMAAADGDLATRPSAWTPAAIRQVLGGNLCRCTGYVQILESLSTVRGPHASLEALFPSQRLRAELEVASPDTVVLSGENGNVVLLPDTLDEALAYLTDYPDATVVSGATDVGVRGNAGGVLGTVLYLGRIAELREISIDTNTLTVGAAVSLTELGAALRHVVPELEQLVDRFGSAQIRNCATVGGNLARGSPVADLLPLLLVSESEIELVSRAGPRRILVEEFLRNCRSTARAAGEIIHRVFVPRPLGGSVRRFYKVSKRRYLDIGTVTAAIVTHTSGGTVTKARVALGGIGRAAMRVRPAEAALEGRTHSLETFARAGQVAASHVSPQDDLRSSGEYLRRLVANLFRQYYWDSCGDTPAVR